MINPIRPKKSFKKLARDVHCFPESGCKDKQLIFYSPNILEKKIKLFFFPLIISVL